MRINAVYEFFFMKPSNLNYFIERYISGVSLQQIGREIGVKGDTVGRWLSGLGVRIRTKSEAMRISKLKEPPPDFILGILQVNP